MATIAVKLSNRTWRNFFYSIHHGGGRQFSDVSCQTIYCLHLLGVGSGRTVASLFVKIELFVYMMLLGLSKNKFL